MRHLRFIIQNIVNQLLFCLQENFTWFISYHKPVLWCLLYTYFILKKARSWKLVTMNNFFNCELLIKVVTINIVLQLSSLHPIFFKKKINFCNIQLKYPLIRFWLIATISSNLHPFRCINATHVNWSEILTSGILGWYRVHFLVWISCSTANT